MTRVAGFVLLLLIAAPVPAQTVSRTVEPVSDSAPPSLRHLLRWAGGDALALPPSLSRRHLTYAAVAAGALVLVTAADARLSGDAGLLRRADVGPVLNVANEFGNPTYVRPLVIGVLAASLLTESTHFQDAAFTSLQSVVYTGAVTGLLKQAFGRARPHHLEGPFEFEPFSGLKALPSCHTSLAFSVVVPWAVYYPNPVTYGLVALAGGTALARVARGDHWPSDVLAGAAIGSLTGYLLARRHLDQRGVRVPDAALMVSSSGLALRLALP